MIHLNTHYKRINTEEWYEYLVNSYIFIFVMTLISIIVSISISLNQISLIKSLKYLLCEEISVLKLYLFIIAIFIYLIIILFDSTQIYIIYPFNIAFIFYFMKNNYDLFIAIFNLILLYLYLTYIKYGKSRKKKERLKQITLKLIEFNEDFFIKLIIFLFPFILYDIRLRTNLFSNIIFIVFGILLYLSYILKIIHYFLQKNKLNPYIISSIFFSVSIYLIGMVFISTYVAPKDLHLNLNEFGTSNQFKNYEIVCYGVDGKVILGESINCTIKNMDERYKLVKLTLIEHLNNGSVIKICEDISANTTNNENSSSECNQKINGTILNRNTVKIGFEVYLRSNENSSLNKTLSTETKYRYPRSWEEYKEQSDKYISYLLSLLGFIILSIPFGVKNIRDLIEEGNH